MDKGKTIASFKFEVQKSLKKRIRSEAEKRGRSLNQTVSYILSREIRTLDSCATDFFTVVNTIDAGKAEEPREFIRYKIHPALHSQIKDVADYYGLPMTKICIALFLLYFNRPVGGSSKALPMASQEAGG